MDASESLEGVSGGSSGGSKDSPGGLEAVLWVPRDFREILGGLRGVSGRLLGASGGASKGLRKVP